MDNKDISMPAAKATSALAAAGLTWSEWAALLAGFYTFLLISEWFWKRAIRPFAERKGWLKRKRSRIITVEEYQTDQGELS